MDVANWLRALGLERYEAAFRENDVNAQLLPNLTAGDLRDLGVTSVGHRRQLLEAIAALRLEGTPTVDPGRPSSPTGNLAPAETTAERRPVSVMFCDLIGSTALSSRLDPEDLREVIRTYQACVAETIRRFDGFIARYVGDGVLIYFGWPEARETDAERAVRAGLAVAAAVSAAPVSGESLRVRIGIATGLVVIGEAIGAGDSRQHTAVGETPNLAARLQGLAGPDQVVIDAATRRQIGGLFACEDLGTIELKGFPVAVPTWLVSSENRALGQFEALRSGATPLVGRDEEMELLLRRWAQARAGSGRVVLISAEPGVGKSRLAETLAERIAAEPQTRLRYFCSPHHQDSAFYPVIAQMERAAGFAYTDAPAARLAKLQSLLGASSPPMEDVALIADLHALPSRDFAPPRDVTPQRKKDKTFEALLRHIEVVARHKPVLMLFDDLHWIDPSSRELLDRMMERVADWPVLLLAMFRPEFQPPWTGQPHVTMLTLARLDRGATATMVKSVAGDATLPSEIMEEITERTDGVPLFVEELTRAVLESGTQAPASLSAVPRPGLSVPATLHASLMARLDRLGPAAKDVAQIGAAFGRAFEFEQLASTTDLPANQLHEALDRLTNAGLLIVRGIRPHASYIFKHALVQDVAYSTLLRSRRQALHARIAATLEDRFPDIALAQPALLAQHCVAAGLAEKAVGYWLNAGRQSMARSAMTEAVAQLRKGLEVLAGLPDGPQRQQSELDLQIALAWALSATKGWAAAEFAEALARTRALAESLDRLDYLIPLFVGQVLHHVMRSEHRKALALSEQLVNIGEAQNDAATQAAAHYSEGFARFYLGELVPARVLLQQCIAHADPDDHVVTIALLAHTVALTGYLDQARSRMDEALSAARRLGNVVNLVDVLMFANDFARLFRSPMVHLDETLALSTEHGLQSHSCRARIQRGRSLVAQGQAQEGLELLISGLAEVRSSGAGIGVPLMLMWIGQAYAMLEQPAEAFDYLAEAGQLIEATEERVGEFALHRIRGDLLNAAGDRLAAERNYRQAIAVAERQSAKLLQLIASTSLARLWRDQDRRVEARDLLAPIYNWFTEGFDAPDLKDANALLDELA
jgi:predicted ATPase/class 3 adenylate cyclase